jgi:hypothetical protein
MSKTYHIGLDGSDWKYNHRSEKWDNGKCDCECYDFPTRVKSDDYIRNNNLNETGNFCYTVEVDVETDDEQMIRLLETLNHINWIESVDDVPPISQDDTYGDASLQNSIRVLVFVKEIDVGIVFGQYNHKWKKWKVEGLCGKEPKVTHWTYITKPE